MKILYIEDSPTNLFMVKKILERQNIEFLSAINGEEGLEIINKKFPEILLLDINLPGLSGYEIAKDIKRNEKLKDMTIIAISSSNDEEDKQIAFAVGFDDYIEKPVNPKTFYNQIMEIHKNKGKKPKISNKEIYLDKYTDKLIDTLKEKISQLEESNLALKKVDKIKSDFIAVASHELKTPIVPIVGYMEMLANEKFGKLNDKQMEIVTKLKDSSKRLSEIIDRMLDTAKLEKGFMTLNLQNINLENLIIKVINNLTPLAKIRNITIEYKIDLNKHTITCDENKIEFILYNILNNAIKFSNDNDKIEINVKNTDEGILFSIKDYGVGIDPTDKEIIFDKFFSGWDVEHHHTSNYEFQGNGIGLGLYISKDFVKMHNGKIWVESEGLNKGSIFYFTVNYNLEKS